MKTGFLRSVIVVSALLAVAAPAFASTQFTLVSDKNGENVDITPSAGIGTEGTTAGDYNATLVTGGTTVSTPVYCIDPFNDISWGGGYPATTTNTATGANGLTSITYVADNGNTNTATPISQEAADEVSYLAYNYLGVTSFSNNISDDANINQAAIQLAIWDLINPAGDYTSVAEDNAYLGNTTDATEISELTTDYLNGAVDDGSNFTSSQVYLIQQAGVTTPNTQEFIYDTATPPSIPNGSPIPPTPEPSLVAFVGSMALALSMMFFMKRKSQTAV